MKAVRCATRELIVYRQELMIKKKKHLKGHTMRFTVTADLVTQNIMFLLLSRSYFCSSFANFSSVYTHTHLLFFSVLDSALWKKPGEIVKSIFILVIFFYVHRALSIQGTCCESGLDNCLIVVGSVGTGEAQNMDQNNSIQAFQGLASPPVLISALVSSKWFS